MARILIAETPQTIRQTISQWLAPALERAGHQVVRQSGYPDNWLEVVRKAAPDVLLMDATLCDVAGGQVQSFAGCEQLKASPDTETIAIVFVTQPDDPKPSDHSAIALRSLESGASDCLDRGQPTETAMARIGFALRTRQHLVQAHALSAEFKALNQTMVDRNRQVEKDLHTARQLQQSLLPMPIEEEEDDNKPHDAADDGGFRFSRCHYRDAHIRISGLYVPSDALGGDLYDVMTFPDSAIGVTIADVSGHGIPAGFITAIFKAAFYRTTHTYQSPSEVLFHLNNELSQIIKTGDYITAFYCRLLENGKKLIYSAAGHPYPLHFKAATNQIEHLSENGPPLVWFPDMDYPVNTVTLEPGDKVLAFSDGLTELKNPTQAMFGEPAFEALFHQTIQASARSQLDAMLETLSDFTEGHPLEDDLSMVLIEVL